METNGKVIEITDAGVVVEVQRVSACTGNCKDCAGCETKKMWITAYTELTVHPGDRVHLVSDRGAVLLGLFVLFILPLLLPTSVYLITANSGFGGWFAAAALVVALLLVWYLSRSKWYLKKTKPQIIDVLD